MDHDYVIILKYTFLLYEFHICFNMSVNSNFNMSFYKDYLILEIESLLGNQKYILYEDTMDKLNLVYVI